MKVSKFNVLYDASWGSSGKGSAVTRLTDIFQCTDCSSNNFSNAGHTTIVNGEKCVVKAMPSQILLHKHQPKQPRTFYIGANSGFFVEQLNKELEQASPNRDLKLIIHPRAVMMDDRHIQMESPTGSRSTEHISSTMSGAGASYSEKAMRSKDAVIVGNVVSSLSEYADITVPETPYDFYKLVCGNVLRNTWIHEVSQGFALSVNSGTHYPHCTFRECTPQQAYADFNIKPDMVGDVYMNVRSFPIRVGNNYNNGEMVGYSGDFMDDQVEMTWEEIGKNAEMPESEISKLAENERTTVTKKIRRVATQSPKLLAMASAMCGATKAIYNFPQYDHWSAYKVRGGFKEFRGLHSKVRKAVDLVEEASGIPVVMIGTGPDHEDFIYLG